MATFATVIARDGFEDKLKTVLVANVTPQGSASDEKVARDNALAIFADSTVNDLVVIEDTVDTFPIEYWDEDADTVTVVGWEVEGYGETVNFSEDEFPFWL